MLFQFSIWHLAVWYAFWSLPIEIGIYIDICRCQPFPCKGCRFGRLPTGFNTGFDLFIWFSTGSIESIPQLCVAILPLEFALHHFECKVTKRFVYLRHIRVLVSLIETRVNRSRENKLVEQSGSGLWQSLRQIWLIEIGKLKTRFMVLFILRWFLSPSTWMWLMWGHLETSWVVVRHTERAWVISRHQVKPRNSVGQALDQIISRSS